MVKFDFLSDTANSILEVCERARIKKEAYIKSLNRKISKKEDKQLTDQFIQEEYVLYLQNPEEYQRKDSELKQDDAYPDVKEDYNYDSLEFDELQDLLDEDEY